MFARVTCAVAVSLGILKHAAWTAIQSALPPVFTPAEEPHMSARCFIHMLYVKDFHAVLLRLFITLATDRPSA